MIKNKVKVALCGSLLGIGYISGVVLFPVSVVAYNNKDKTLSDFKTTDVYIESVESDQEELKEELISGEINSTEYNLKLNEILSDENAVTILKSSSSPLKLNYENFEKMHDICFPIGITALCLTGSALSLSIATFGYTNKNVENKDDEIDYSNIDLC